MKTPKQREATGRIMQRLLLPLVLALLIAVPCLLYPAPAGASAEVLDQSQTKQDSWGMIGSGEYRTGQVFTAGMYGILDRVSVVLANYAPSPATGPVNVSIQTVTDDGLPSGTQIGSGTIPLSAIPPAGSPAWVDVILTSPAKVTAGTKYVLLLSTSGGSDIVAWYMGLGGDVKPYPRGYWVSKAVDTWEMILTNQDWAFKTYVWPPALDQLQTVHSRYNRVGAGNRLAQTFTVGMYGMLDQVSVLLENWSNTASGDIMVSIETLTAAGLPSGTQVSSGIIPFSAIPPTGALAWVDVMMSDAYVTPGTRYALVLALNGGGYVWWADNDTGSTYSGGSELIGYATGGWSTMSSYDTAFKTYVMPSALDQSQTVISGLFRTTDCADQKIAQTFTAARSGILDRLSLYLGYGASNGNLTVTIQKVPLESGTQIWSRTIPFSALPPAPGSGHAWVDFNISGVNVTAGTKYAIVVSSNDTWFDSWFGGNAYIYIDEYEAGAAYTYNVCYPSHAWYDRQTDLAFKTYVIPATMVGSGVGSPPPTPAAVIQNMEIIERMIAGPAQIPTGDIDGARTNVKENRRDALLNKLEAVIVSVKAAADSTYPAVKTAGYQSAIDQLNSLLDKTDGCALRGTPDTTRTGFTPDWIITCASQELIDPLIRSSLTILQTLLEQGVDQTG